MSNSDRFNAATEFATHALSGICEALPVPALTMTPCFRVITLNADAKRHLKTGEVLTVRAGRISTAHARYDAEFRRLVAAVLDDSNDSQSRILRVERTANDGVVLLSIAPMISVLDDGAEAVVIDIRISDVDHGLDIRGEHMKSAWDLTTAEQSLVRGMLKGLSPREVAARRFVSRHTIETQLKSVRNKIGVHDKVELMRRIVHFAMTTA